ncbi:MAG TPA: hypothetical protein VF989_07425 [Polyangiaceae bacterium]
MTVLYPVARPTRIGFAVLALTLATALGRAARANEDDGQRSSPDDALEEDEASAQPTRTLPPPRAARPEDQMPRPIPELTGEPATKRPVDLGADAGVIWLVPRDNRTSYAPGFAWGAHLAVAITPWFWATPFFSLSKHSVDAADVLGSESLGQPRIELTRLGVELSPVWVMSERVRSYLGFSLGWARLEAPAAATSGVSATRIGERAGVFIHGSAALGTRFDVVPNLVTLSGSLQAGFATNQSGSAFSTAQGVDAEGSLEHVAPLSKIDGVFGAFVSVGVAP